MQTILDLKRAYKWQNSHCILNTASFPLNGQLCFVLNSEYESDFESFNVCSESLIFSFQKGEA